MITFEDVENNMGFYVCRAKVPGGWLVVVTVDNIAGFQEGGAHYRSAPTFVPDPKHEWLRTEREG